MKKTILTSIITSVAIIITALNVPAKFFSFDYWTGGLKFGAFALTDISSTDNLSAYPTVQNANNTALETQINSIIGTTTNTTLTTLNSLTSASSLATVGTITSGTWNGTLISVAKGGTGTTSLPAYSILFGSSTELSALYNLGSSGQSLVSNGAGAMPSWQSVGVNQADSYIWTGDHNFIGTTTIKNLNASSTVANPLKLNGVSYAFPSSIYASSTTLMSDASGNLSWNKPDWELLGSSVLSSPAATNTVSFTARNTLRVYIDVLGQNGVSGGDAIVLRFNGGGYGGYTSNIFSVPTFSAVVRSSNSFRMDISNSTSTRRTYIIDIDNRNGYDKVLTISGNFSSSTPFSTAIIGDGLWATTTQITSISVTQNNPSFPAQTGSSLTVYGSRE